MTNLTVLSDADTWRRVLSPELGFAAPSSLGSVGAMTAAAAVFRRGRGGEGVNTVAVSRF